jgi:succinate dehydrogenase / fumarate reductase cytochrome b subunit
MLHYLQQCTLQDIQGVLMAAAAPPATPAAPTPHGIKGVQPLRAGQGHSYFWRKLHSLSGIVPIGAFLIEHIVSNFEAINGPLAYAKQVLFLNSLPMVRILEWAFIFIPLAFHAGYGIFIWLRGRSNVNVYPWVGNRMYLAQRVTGVIALAYIIQHVWRQRLSGVSLPEHPGAAFAKVQHELHNPWMLAIYIIAMIATCWHFSAGVWLFAAKWGITPGDRARKRFGYVCAVAGSALCIMGLISIYAFVGPKYQNAPADVMPEQPAAITMPAPATPPPDSTSPAPSSLQQ